MVRLSKCCVIFPLRAGCAIMGVVFAALAFIGAMNKLIEISMFAQTLNSRYGALDNLQDTRKDYYVQAKIIRFTFVLLVEVFICGSAISFVYGILKERLRFMPPFIVHLSLKVGYYLVHYFDVATKHLEKNDTVNTALRLYTFGLILSGIFSYLWLCCYSLFQEMKERKDVRLVGLLNPQSEL